MGNPESARYYDKDGITKRDIEEAWDLDRDESNILKYLLRWRTKHDTDHGRRSDLDKLIECAQHLRLRYFGGTGQDEYGNYFRVPATPVRANGKEPTAG